MIILKRHIQLTSLKRNTVLKGLKGIKFYHVRREVSFVMFKGNTALSSVKLIQFCQV